MGGSLGCHRSIPRDPTDFSSGKRKYSAACNFSNIMVNQERLNINTATEEELMTLPGVNRIVAQNIVEYRDCIGGFKKVEDLALVSGVGATKLEAIKLEICVSSRTSSSQHSPSSIRKDFDCQSSNGININTATPAQLMSIKGITEKIAKNIVAFRTENGPFRTIEDLVRVNHINSSLLDKIRFQIYVQRSRAASTNTNGGLTFTTKSQPSPTSFSLKSDDLDLPPGGPTQIPSFRPKVEPPSGVREGKPVVRLATWSLQGCSNDKANNPGVREVVCMTLLENGIKLLAVQDLLDREALDKFCVELNQASLSSVRNWKSPRGLWKSAVSERPTGPSTKGRSFCGFMWDSASGIDLKEAAILESTVTNGNGTRGQPGLYKALFTVGSYELKLVNVHMQITGAENGTNGTNGKNGHSDENKHHRLSPGILDTLRGPDASNPPLRPSSGHCVVVREGMTNPWIPDNWSWGGVASDHCPVLAELYLDLPHKDPPRPGVTVDRGEELPKHER
ncbi:endonuclease/exonuclease/phosphatase family domain-containing protein 1 [Boleophthalmus pectinirostris]|uniref:endonuclease/exonuclease/phosphatase family domain-containing protein 1 n=1 Tax=Boleophthalmus pectinirostris TaxID=150288 RepID=UPI00242B2FBD|nr:endonuclease/exonuclease/phosphatase family domain-containing protein 1 [Boleophthalmus pectinirostris]